MSAPIPRPSRSVAEAFAARSVRRPHNETLQLPGARSIAVERFDSILNGDLLGARMADRRQLSYALASE
jgi:hypothetical protein